MKNKTIQLVGKHIKENDDEFEDGYVEIKVDVQSVLYEIDDGELLDYFTDSELIDELDYRGYGFDKYYTKSECIEYLEDMGYTVSDEEGKVGDYDSIDNGLLDDIVSVFDSLTVFERRELRDLVLSFSSAK